MNDSLVKRLLVVGLGVSALLLGSISSSARADVAIDYNVRADFELAFLSGTPFNPEPGMTPFLPFQAFGPLTFVLDDEVLNPAATTAPFIDVTGQLNGFDAITSLNFSLSPDLEFVGGDLTNIVRDGVDNVVSASVQDLSMKWEMIVDPNGQNLRLFTKVGLPFNGDIDDFQNPVGSVISGLDPFEVYLDLGGGDSALVAIGQNRTLTIVPEPSTFVLFGILATGLIVVGIGRRRWRLSESRSASAA